MKICIPINEDRGLDSPVCGHFGSAPGFLVTDTETAEFHVQPNGNQHHAHGMCQPLQALGEVSPEALIVGGIGRGALLKLNASGIRVFLAVDGNVAENLTALREGRLPEASPETACGHHGHGTHAGGGCGHSQS